MGALVLFGLEIVIGVVLGVVFAAVGMFFGNICLFESIAVGIILGLVARYAWMLHTGVAWVIAIAAVALLYILQNTSVGFWVVGGLFSAAWALLVALIVYEASGYDKGYAYMSLAIGAVAFMGLHLFARSKQARA